MLNLSGPTGSYIIVER